MAGSREGSTFQQPNASPAEVLGRLERPGAGGSTCLQVTSSSSLLPAHARASRSGVLEIFPGASAIPCPLSPFPWEWLSVRGRYLLPIQLNCY